MKGLLYTYLATYLGAGIALFYPFVGLGIYLNFAIVKPPSMWYWSVTPGHYDRWVAIAMLIGWVIKGTGRWNLGRGTMVMMLYVAFFLWMIPCAVLADKQAIAQANIIVMSKTLLPFLVGVTLATTTGRVKALAWILVLSQGYVAYEMNLSYLAGVNRAQQGGFGGMDNNTLALTMVTGTGLAFFMGMGDRRLWAKALAFLSATLMAHTVMFSFSRGGMLGLCIGACAGLFLVPWKTRHVIVFSLAVMLGFRLAGPEVRERFMSVFVDPEERDASSSSRLRHWKACWEIMQAKPAFGVGPRNFPSHNRGVEAHSIWMQCGAEMGFPGLILLLSFYGVSVLRLLPFCFPKVFARPPPPDPLFPFMARGIIVSLIGFGVSGQFVSLIGMEQSYYLNMVAVSILALSTPGVLKVDKPTPPTTSPPAGS